MLTKTTQKEHITISPYVLLGTKLCVLLSIPFLFLLYLVTNPCLPLYSVRMADKADNFMALLAGK